MQPRTRRILLVAGIIYDNHRLDAA